MDTFLQTQLPAVVWASLLAVVIGLYVLKGGKRRPADRGVAGSFLAALATIARVLVGGVLIAAGIGSFLVGRRLQELPILRGRDSVGVVQVWWTRGDSGAMLNLSRTDDRGAQGGELIEIPSTTWGLRAEVIRWPTWSATLGLRPVYRMKDLVAWDERETPARLFVRPLPYSRLDLWNQILKYGPRLPGFPAIEEMATRRVRAAENTIYRLVVTPQGFEINEEYTRVTPDLSGQSGGQI